MSAVAATQQSIPSTRIIVPTRNRLKRFSKIVCFLVLGLIFKGALVTSHNAGLSVPDWPTTYGENMFTFPYSKWVGGIFYEHGHRLYASGVGFLTVILTFWIWFTEKRTNVRLLGLAALAMVMIQGMLGGLTVRLGLSDWVSIAHGVLGQTFFILTLIIAYLLSDEWRRRPLETATPDRLKLYRWAIFAAVLVYGQLIIGATVRHTFSGLAIPDFPTTGGEWIPSFSEQSLARINAMRDAINLAPIENWNVLIQFTHRVMALFLVLLVSSIGYLAWARRAELPVLVKRSASYVVLAIACQFCFGVATIWSRKEPFTTSFHVVIGAALLGLTVLLALRCKMPASAE